MYIRQKAKKKKDQYVKDRSTYPTLYAPYIITNKNKKISKFSLWYHNKKLAVFLFITIMKKATLLLYLNLHYDNNLLIKPNSAKSFQINNWEFDME